jgi:short-subunit dehydrogenase
MPDPVQTATDARPVNEATGRSLAVITGASSGIGCELARVFATQGFDLLVTAEDEELDRAADELRAQSDGGVTAARSDLATPEGVEQLSERIKALRRPVDALAVNAGIGAGGAFATDTDVEKELRLIDAGSHGHRVFRARGHAGYQGRRRR